MTVIVTAPDGKIYVFTKGADNVLREKLKSDNKLQDITDKYLTEYSQKGLRTLMIVYKEITKLELEEWEIEYNV